MWKLSGENSTVVRWILRPHAGRTLKEAERPIASREQIHRRDQNERQERLSVSSCKPTGRSCQPDKRHQRNQCRMTKQNIAGQTTTLSSFRRALPETDLIR